MAESSTASAPREREGDISFLAIPGSGADNIILLDVEQDIPPRRSSRHHRVSSDPGTQAVTASIDTTSAPPQRQVSLVRQHQPRRSGQSPVRYPFHLRTYMPDIEQGDEIASSLRNFEKHFLSEDTVVNVVQCDERVSNLEEQTWDQENIIEMTSTVPRRVKAYRLFFINRYLLKNNQKPPPADPKRLRISPTAFRALLSCYEVPPAFVNEMVTNFNLGSGRGTRVHENGPHEGLTYDLWYMIPIRVSFDCTKTGEHARSHPGNNQMNPSHFLHLPDAKIDIRGSQIGLFFQYNVQTRSVAAMCVNFLDGKWHKMVDSLQNRVKESLDHNRASKAEDDPFFIHLIYLSSIIRWWNNCLRSFNEQLIEHERSLQGQIDNADAVDSERHTEFNNNINKALHCMSAHLQRFSSEIAVLQETTQFILDEHQNFFQAIRNPRHGVQKIRVGDALIGDDERIKRGLLQTLAQAKALELFRGELQHKTENISALLFNNIRVVNERAQVLNGLQMQHLLKATQEETKVAQRMARSAQKLTEETLKDSISMKTIAIVVMAFLPGATFAALLATPFFTTSDNAFLKKAGNVWLWIVLTIPTTMLCFGFYFWKRRMDLREVREIDRDGDLEARVKYRRPRQATQPAPTATAGQP